MKNESLLGARIVHEFFNLLHEPLKVLLVLVAQRLGETFLREGLGHLIDAELLEVLALGQRSVAHSVPD